MKLTVKNTKAVNWARSVSCLLCSCDSRRVAAGTGEYYQYCNVENRSKTVSETRGWKGVTASLERLDRWVV